MVLDDLQSLLRLESQGLETLDGGLQLFVGQLDDHSSDLGSVHFSSKTNYIVKDHGTNQLASVTFRSILELRRVDQTCELERILLHGLMLGGLCFSHGWLRHSVGVLHHHLLDWHLLT